jgi:hypothetical protein
MRKMSAKMIRRLIEWLKAKGMTETEIVNCFEYISK